MQKEGPQAGTDPLETRPQTIAIVALGPSSYSYQQATCGKKGFITPDEVWVCNSGINAFRADKAFIMDDLVGLEPRFPDWCARLRTEETPIVTCRAYPQYPSSVAYPLEFVRDSIKDDIFTTSVAYMVGYAIAIQVKEMYLFGCDFWYPNAKAVEGGLANVSYLLGIAKERGINFKIPQASTLLDAHMVQVDKEGNRTRPLYGYDYNPGESQRRIAAGEGTRLDQLVAERAPRPAIDPRQIIDLEKADGSA